MMTNEVVIEFSDLHYNPAARGTGRIAYINVVDFGENVRVVIKAENPVSNNLGFVVLSDATLPMDLFNKVILPNIQSPDYKVVKGSL